MKDAVRVGIAGVALLAVLGGLWVMGTALGWWLPVALVAFGAVATIPVLARGCLSLACAALVAMLALIAVNVVLDALFDVAPDRWIRPGYRLPITAGLGLAVLVFAGVSYYYLRAPWLPRHRRSDENATEERQRTRVLAPGWKRRFAVPWSVALAFGVIVGLPPFVAWLHDRNQPTATALPNPQRLGSPLDVVLVTDGTAPQSPATFGSPPPAPTGEIQFSVGQAKGRAVLWTRTQMSDASDVLDALTTPGSEQTAPPEIRDHANAVIVLLLSPVARCAGQRERWEAIAGAAQDAVESKIPVVSLLATSDPDATACWKRSKLFDASQPLGKRTVTDAAVGLGLAASNSQPYFDLAVAHRPILLFDSKEPVPRPLSIEQMFEARRVHQCSDLASGGKCDSPPVATPADLESPGMHLVIEDPRTDLKRLARDERDAWRAGESRLGPRPDQVLGFGSRIYYNPVRVAAKHHRQLLYLDYWWYLPDNPAGSGKRAFCGAGLVILGVTCFDHESDWEGVTVELELVGQAWKPVAVHYAQHESVVRYDWSQLRKWWNRDGVLGGVLGRVTDRRERPVVFVARGTHASYAHRCNQGCRQIPATLEEGDHDGAVPWVGDATSICQTVSCLAALPTTTGARGPASWNAFAGPWGTRHCVWAYYCDRGTPPAAPGQQDRYQHPADYDGSADVDARDGGYEKGREPRDA